MEATAPRVLTADDHQASALHVLPLFNVPLLSPELHYSFYHRSRTLNGVLRKRETADHFLKRFICAGIGCIASILCVLVVVLLFVGYAPPPCYLVSLPAVRITNERVTLWYAKWGLHCDRTQPYFGPLVTTYPAVVCGGGYSKGFCDANEWASKYDEELDIGKNLSLLIMMTTLGFGLPLYCLALITLSWYRIQAYRNRLTSIMNGEDYGSRLLGHSMPEVGKSEEEEEEEVEFHDVKIQQSKE